MPPRAIFVSVVMTMSRPPRSRFPVRLFKAWWCRIAVPGSPAWGTWAPSRSLPPRHRTDLPSWAARLVQQFGVVEAAAIAVVVVDLAPRSWLHCFHQQATLVFEVGAPALGEYLVDAQQQVGETGQLQIEASWGSRFRQKRARVCRGSRNMVSGQPPVCRGQELVGRLIDLVQIGPLLAIDLDVDEVSVHHRRRCLASSNDSCAMTWHQWQAE